MSGKVWPRRTPKPKAVTLRRKPESKRAMRFDGTTPSGLAVIEFAGLKQDAMVTRQGFPAYIAVPTREGYRSARPGDWVAFEPSGDLLVLDAQEVADWWEIAPTPQSRRTPAPGTQTSKT